jgi:hypothetical protein
LRVLKRFTTLTQGEKIHLSEENQGVCANLPPFFASQAAKAPRAFPASNPGKGLEAEGGLNYLASRLDLMLGSHNMRV